MKIMLLQRFGQAIRFRHKPSGLTVPIEIVLAGDKVSDLFRMYKVLGADRVNKGYWPERGIVHADGFSTILSLYHTDMWSFSQYQSHREKGTEKEWIKNFRNDTDRIEIVISQPEDRVLYDVTSVIGDEKSNIECGSYDDVVVAVMSYVHQTSPVEIFDYIKRFEALWGFESKEQIALEM